MGTRSSLDRRAFRDSGLVDIPEFGDGQMIRDAIG
jgi:hypothetical protein